MGCMTRTRAAASGGGRYYPERAKRIRKRTVRHHAPVRRPALTSTLLAVALALAGCGLNVASADLFVLHRRGPGPELNALLSDGGTVRCGTTPAQALPDPLLLAARDLA